MKQLKNFKEKTSYFFTKAVRSFTGFERVVFGLLVLTMTVSVIGIISTVNRSISVLTPVRGGSYTEGLLGSPRFINPVLANTESDRDLSHVIYSGLMRESGALLTPDLAEEYTVSEDEKVYTFTLREDVMFHDGVPLTADDVVFTIERIQNASLNSPLQTAWRGVQVKKIDMRTVEFTLIEPYGNFLENTVVGILPQHIWQNFNTEQFMLAEENIQAIGSGPFKVANIQRNRAGLPTTMTLKSFKSKDGHASYLKRLTFKFYANEDSLITAFQKNDIDGLGGVDPDKAVSLAEKDNVVVYHESLPRVFGIFFNKNQQTLFLDKNVAEALNKAINKDAIVRRVLSGYGTPLNGPLPPSTPGYTTPTKDSLLTAEDRLTEARSLLEKAGWRLNKETGLREKNGETLTFSLATSNTPELKEVATMVKEQLASIGVTMQIQIFETGNLEQDVIRPRTYDALLFGQALQYDTDLFAFWHSSQRNDPGINVAMLANTRVDDLLNKAFRENDRSERAELYKELAKEINDTSSAVFLYSPHYLYLQKKGVQGVTIAGLRTASDRFNQIPEWFKNEQFLWHIFTKKQ